MGDARPRRRRRDVAAIGATATTASWDCPGRGLVRRARFEARLRYRDKACERDLGRHIAGRAETVGEALARERPLLRALPPEPFPTAEESLVRVDQKGLVTVRQNRYSVPVRLAGLRVRAAQGRDRSARPGIRTTVEELERFTQTLGSDDERRTVDGWLHEVGLALSVLLPRAR